MQINKGVFLDLGSVDDGDLQLNALDRTLPEWRFFDATPAAEIAERAADAHLIITNKTELGGALIRSLKALRMIAVAATGTNCIDLEAARERSVVVCNVRDYCSDSVAQHVLGLILNLATGQPFYAQRVREGDWSRAAHFSLHDRPIRELHSLTLGIIGYGSLGRAVAALARAMGMNVLLGEVRGRKPRPDRLAFRELMTNADVVSLHCPLTAETGGMIDRRVLRGMKPGAILINTARGGIVVEQDLADALRAGELAGAGVDVLSVEPPPPDHPLLADDVPNLIVTPHNAWASQAARQACIDQLTGVINAFLRGQPVNRVV